MIRHSEITQCQIQNFWVNYIHFTPPREDLEENSIKRNVIVQFLEESALFRDLPLLSGFKYNIKEYTISF